MTFLEVLQRNGYDLHASLKAELAISDYKYKGVDKGGLGGLKPPQIFWANIIIWGCSHAKVGVVVQKFHVHGLQPPHF